jgi:hypothetical protein
MKAVRAICCCVGFGLCCSSLWGQQTVASSHGLEIASSRLPFESLRPAITAASATPHVLPMTLVFLPSSNLQQAPEFTSSDIACTQAAAPRLLNRNAFDRLNFSSSAVKSIFTHENMVKMARNFVPGQPLPDSPGYVRLTARDKFDMFLRRSYSPDIFSSAIFDSLYSQATGAYPSFGGGMEGYGKRLGVSMAGSEAAAFFGRFLFPTLLHQDPRYFPSRREDTSDRLAYAASRAFIGRSDDGRSVINSSVILSQFVEAALSNAYVPYRTESVSGTVENALAGLGGVIQSNILNEFWPDIRTFLTRHEPKSMRQLEDRWDASTFAQRYKNEGH